MAKSKRQNKNKNKAKAVQIKTEEVSAKTTILDTDKPATAEAPDETDGPNSDDSQRFSAEKTPICVDLVPCSVCLDRQEGDIDGIKTAKSLKSVNGEKSPFSPTKLGGSEGCNPTSLLDGGDSIEAVFCMKKNQLNKAGVCKKEIDASDESECGEVASKQVVSDNTEKCSYVPLASSGVAKRQPPRLVRSATKVHARENCSKDTVAQIADAVRKVGSAEVTETEIVKVHKSLKRLSPFKQELHDENLSANSEPGAKKLMQNGIGQVDAEDSGKNLSISEEKSEVSLASSILMTSTNKPFSCTDTLTNPPCKEENIVQSQTTSDSSFETPDDKMDEINDKSFVKKKSVINILHRKDTAKDQSQIIQAKLPEEHYKAETLPSFEKSSSLVFGKVPAKRSHKLGKKSSKKKYFKSVKSEGGTACGRGSHKPAIFFSDKSSDFAVAETDIKMKAGKKENKSINNKGKNIELSKDSASTDFAKNSANALVLTRSMIKVSGANGGLMLPMEGNTSRKRHTEARDPWQNLRLEQHACLLWSSEQRRRFQLEHPDAKSSELDEIMRNYWKKMSQKECQRYIQRARNAMNDRNGMQRTRFHNFSRSSAADEEIENRVNDQDFKEEQLQDGLQNQFACSEHTFGQVARCINAKLKYLQKNLTMSQYQKFVEEFYRRLAESEKYKTQQLKNDCEEQPKYNETMLKLMQTMIRDQEKILKHCKREQFAVKRRRLMETYDVLIEQVLQGSDAIPFSDVKSDVLTELLCDLEDLESKTMSSSRLSGPELDLEENAKIDDLAEVLSLRKHALIDTEPLEDALPSIEDALYQKLLLYEMSCQANLLQLPVEDIEKCFDESYSYSEIMSLRDQQLATMLPSDVFLMDAFSRIFRQMAGIETCCELNSPSCILNDLLIASKLQLVENGSACHPETTFSTRHNGESEPEFVNSLPAISKKNGGTADIVPNVPKSSNPLPEVLHSGMLPSLSDHSLLPDSDLEGIFGVDSWLTNSIVDQCPIQQDIDTGLLEDININCADFAGQLANNPFSMQNRTSNLQNSQLHSSSYLGPWSFQDQGDDLNFFNIFQDGSAIESAPVDSDD